MRTKLALAAAATSLAVVPTVLVSAPSQADSGKITHEGHRQVLIVKYHVDRECTIVPNYPTGQSHSEIKVPAGATLNWRYNVNSKVAAVSIPGGKKNGFPWWGFVTDSGCLGKSELTKGKYVTLRDGKVIKTVHKYYPAGHKIPTVTLKGRGQQATVAAKFAKFVPVHWRPSHGAVPSRLVEMKHPATLRDDAGRFVIGNVFEGWHVRATTERKRSWTKVYVPAIKRWGWVQL